MATPTEQFAVVLVDDAGRVKVGSTRYYTTAADGRAGVEDMLRAAPLGTTAWVYQIVGHVEVAVDFTWSPV